MTLGWWLLGCGLLSSCATTAPDHPAEAVGVRRWLGPSGEGELDLRSDRTFVLAIVSREGRGGSLSGTWTWHSGRWPVADKPLVHDPSDPGMVTLRVDVTNGDSHIEVGTSLIALLSTDCATYDGVDGVVDLNWGM